MKLFPFFLLPLLLAGSALALDCKTLQGEKLEACNDILESDLSAQAKNESVLAIMSQDYFAPNFTFTERWNANISFSDAPKGVPVANSAYIRDGWLRIISVTPSVEENGRLLVPSEGRVLSAYGYWVEVPSGTAGGDCKTDYSLSSNSADLDIYANSALIGHGKVTAFKVAEDTVFSSNLKIDAAITVNHYQNVKYCCDTSNGYCVKYCTECWPKNTETLTDSLQLKDQLNTALYNPITSRSLSAISRYYNTTAGRLSFSNFTGVKLSFENSSYEKQLYTYQLVTSFAPYNVLSYKATPAKYSRTKNLFAEEQNSSVTFVVKNAAGCQLALNNHFGQEVEACSLSEFPQPLEISIDKITYFEGDTIMVTIKPNDKPVTVKYGNSSQSAFGTANFTAVYPYNKVSAGLGELSAERVVAVQERGSLPHAAHSQGAGHLPKQLWAIGVVKRLPVSLRLNMQDIL